METLVEPPCGVFPHDAVGHTPPLVFREANEYKGAGSLFRATSFGGTNFMA